MKKRERGRSWEHLFFLFSTLFYPHAFSILVLLQGNILFYFFYQRFISNGLSSGEDFRHSYPLGKLEVCLEMSWQMDLPCKKRGLEKSPVEGKRLSAAGCLPWPRSTPSQEPRSPGVWTPYLLVLQIAQKGKEGGTEPWLSFVESAQPQTVDED